MTITFETAQQLFYIRRFNLGSDATFFSLLKNQTYRWLIWVAISYFLIRIVKNKRSNNAFTFLNFINYSIVVIGLVSLNIIIIAITQLIINGDSIFTLSVLNDYLVFFMFQKAPMYTLGYFSIATILHLYFTNEQLHHEIQTLSDLKKQNTSLYKELSPTLDDKTTILNIKIGNKRKIIPVTDITWIEADDYCVKVHTSNSMSYTMRSSLKALEQKLENNFLRVHRKAIVNMDLIKEVNLSQNPIIILENKTEISISKSNIKIVKDFIS